MTFGSHKRKCLICRAEFMKKRAMQKIPDDHIDCLVKHAENERVKLDRKALRERSRALKVEKREHKQKLDASKPLRWHLNRAQAACNAYIRARDYGKPCICCGEPIDWNGTNTVDAGHWRTVAAAGHLRFNEDNIHAQRKFCNKEKAGNQAGMEQGMIRRIGKARVEALRNSNEIKNWTREELAEVTAYFRAKTKEVLKNRVMKEAA